MVIKPTQDNIVIRLPKVEKEQTTKSGIIIANPAAQDMPEKGIVEAVGSGRILNNGTKLDIEVSVGDEVIFSKFAGTRIMSGEDEFLIVKENDILAIVNK